MSRMLVILSLIAVSINVIYAAGGVAELKALTGDAPYLGFGNQEQAPEYFGDAMVRQYYQNPSYGYAPRNPYSNYNYRAAYAPYRQPMYPGGGFYPGAYSGAQPAPIESSYIDPAPVAPVSSVAASSATRGGFYTGRGNDWVKA